MSEDIGETMTGKLGPLPVWAWGGIAAGVTLIGYLYYKNRTPVAVSASPVASGGSYQTTGITPAQPQSISSSGDIVTWINRAASAVAGQSATSPSDVLATLQTWYEGGSISAAQQSIVDQAIKLQGTPPTLPLSISPVTPTTPAPPKPISLIRDGHGSISAVYDDGTKGEFTNMDAYQSYIAQHPGLGPWAQISNTAYASIKTSVTNPTGGPKASA